MSERYRIASDGGSITCLRCGRTSYHWHDVKNTYCGYCHMFLDTMTPGSPSWKDVRKWIVQDYYRKEESSMPFTEKQIEDMFTYQPPQTEDKEAYYAINIAARELAWAIIRNTPPSPDQSAAIRKVREARMTANAAIALKGRF